MAEIAAVAVVSRQLLYFYFQNRAGLLAAMARYHDVASRFAERVAVAGELTPVEGLEELRRAWLGYVPEILPVARWRQPRSQARKVGLRGATACAVCGRSSTALSSGWKAMAGVRTGVPCRPRLTGSGRGHLEGWQHLVVERGWSPEDYEERVVRSVLAVVLAQLG